ncbi:MAG TPA: NAD(P)-dependent oxidoreductase [Verrucomicrobiae bacterium]|jgi:GDP-L-fucose synthase|nr:NAD(P)-dependent oxidoreductase [Verrucomicrobiae bacterium]
MKLGKVFVAGGTGLVGKNMVKRLEAMGVDYQASYYQSQPLFCRSKYRRVDFQKFDETMEALKGVSELIICAAVTHGVKRMKENPGAGILPNLKITSHLLEAARRQKVSRVVFLGSGTVYQEAEHPIREDDLNLNLPPYGLYLGIGGLSRYLEQLCFFYAKQFGMQIGIFRLSNVYGPHDHFGEDRSHVLPALIRRALKKENPFKVWGRASVVRDFIYVEDVVEAILRLLDKHCRPDPINFSYGKGVTIGEAVKTILQVCGHSVAPQYDESAPTAIPYRVLDCTKFEQLLGPLPRTSLEEGVRRTVAWAVEEDIFKTRAAKTAPKTRYLLTGVSSGLGRYLHERLGGEGLTRENAPEVLESARAKGCDVVVHAAFSAPKTGPSSMLAACLEDNIGLTQKLAEVPHRKMIYISSIDVYPKTPGPHSEDEDIHFRDIAGFYGIMKLTCEALVQQKCPNHLILRCSAFLGRYSRKANLKVIAEDPKPELKLQAGSRFNYILHEDVAAFIEYAVEHDLRGIYNVASSGAVTLSEIAEWVKKKPVYGDYLYDSGDISNRKIAAVFPALKKTSRQVAEHFLASEYSYSF